MKSVRIGIIGAGGIAQAHVRELQRIPQAEIVAVCDVDESRARSAAESLRASMHSCGEDLIRRETIDAVYICVPPNAHGDLEILAARKGLHIFVEKPVNLDLRAAVRAADSVRESGIMSQAGYVLRYNPVFKMAHDFLRDKEIGAAQVCRWNGLVGPPWWRKYDESGGQLVEMTTHQIDMLRWIMGEVESVTAHYSFNRLFRSDDTVTIPDSQAALLRFPSGAVATINTSCAVGKASLGSMEFAIKDAIVRITPEAVLIDPVNSYNAPGEPAMTPGIDESFVRAIQSGDPSLLLSPFEDAVRTLAVTLAANRSAEAGGRPVLVDEIFSEASR